MRQVRELSLLNAAGRRYALNGQNGVYASNLEGFGFALDPELIDLGRGFFQESDNETEPVHPVPFTITFTRNAYQTYRQFVDWLFSAEKLSLVYKPYGDVEFFRDVTIGDVQKSELTVGRWLEVSCSFRCLGPWYRPEPTVLIREPAEAGDGMRYPYRYTDTLRYRMDSASTLKWTVAGTGHIPGAVELNYSGALLNPRIRLVGNVSGKTYGICSVEAELTATDTLKFSSRYDGASVVKISADGSQRDLLDVLDLKTEPFFRIPVSEPCSLFLESEMPVTGTAELLIYYYYRSV